MNILILKEFNSNRVVYLYQPEGKGEFGEVLYDFAENDAKITKQAGEKSVWHDNKALYKVRECVEKKTFLWSSFRLGINY